MTDFDPQILDLQRRLDRAEADNASLREEVTRLRACDDRLRLKRMAIENGDIDIEVECKAHLQLLADIYINWLNAVKAENYLEIDAVISAPRPENPAPMGLHLSGTSENVIISIQRRQGHTPHELRLLAEKERDEAYSARDTAVARCLTLTSDVFGERERLTKERDEARLELDELKEDFGDCSWTPGDDGVFTVADMWRYYLARGEVVAERSIHPGKTEHYERVELLHGLMGQPGPNKPSVPSEDVRRKRARLVAEEALELVEALGFQLITGGGEYGQLEIEKQAEDIYNPGLFEWGLRSVGWNDNDLPHVAKEAADVSVVAVGALIEMGLKDRPILEAIDKNNLDKLGPGHSFREDGKLLRPPGHQPPDMTALLAKQGWSPT